MAIKDQVTVQDIGRSYAEAVRGQPTAKRLWVSTGPDYVALWLLTKPVDMDTRRRFFVPVADMYDRFPDAHMRFHVIDPSEYDGLDLEHDGPDLDRVRPADAVEIPLQHG